ncbi:hypothetical protein TrVFT333_006451 [Trichoderma virens FT-333]|nr:hypothetical protein TrVFT333_006451 [Trichoderma virens FT-333]
MAVQTATKTRTHNEYTVGWVCALSKEQTAATAILDVRYDCLPKPLNDPNTYTLGSIGKYNIVIACLPEGEIGTNLAATFATWMISTFPSIKFGLMVSIGGGIPLKTTLQAAAEKGHQEIVKKLLAAGADVNAAIGYSKWTALQAAAEKGHQKIVKKLLAAGANVNAAVGNYGETALQAAAGNGHQKIVKKLLAAGANVNTATGDLKGTALQAAARNGHQKIIKKLLAAEADANAIISYYKWTALQAAAENGHQEIVKKLLAAGADVNAAAAASVKGKLKEDSNAGPWYWSKRIVRRHQMMLISLEQRTNKLADIIKPANRPITINITQTNTGSGSSSGRGRGWGSSAAGQFIGALALGAGTGAAAAAITLGATLASS